MSNILANRAIGAGLVTVMALPFVLTLIAVVIVGQAAVHVGGIYGSQIAGIARSVNEEIAPRLDELRDSYQNVAAGVQRFQGDARRALGRLGSVPDLAIQRGQFGSTPSVRLVVPNRNYKIASAGFVPEGYQQAGFHLAQFGGSPFKGNPFRGAPSVPNLSNALPSIELRAGSLLNQTLPGQAIPPRRLALSTEPIRAALRPVSQGFDQAIGAVQRPFEEAIQKTTAIAGPLADLRDDIIAVAGPLQQLGRALFIAGLLLAAAVLVFVVTHAVAAVIVTIARPAQSGALLLAGGPLGYLNHVGNSVRKEAVLRLTGQRDEGRTGPLGNPLIVDQPA
ncbi:MAG: hypothetical protein ACFB6S_14770 [Geminicoccaceae bacterium]